MPSLKPADGGFFIFCEALLMSVAIPNGTTFEISSELGAAKVFTAISNAMPAVVTATGHGLSNGEVVVIESAWARLNGRAALVSNATSEAFSLQAIDTSSLKSYPAGAGVGSVRPARRWLQISQVTDPSASGGEQQFVTYGFLEDDEDRQMPTTKSASSLTLPVADDPAQPFVAVVEAADEDKEPRLIRANLPRGAAIYYWAYVSITVTPTLARNNIMTRTITLSLASRPTRYNAV